MSLHTIYREKCSSENKEYPYKFTNGNLLGKFRILSLNKCFEIL